MNKTLILKMNEMKWRCGKCNRKYSTDAFLTLAKIKAVESDTNPKEQHGYVCKCSCGYVFHKDKWHMKTVLEIGQKKIEVSSIDLELEHYGGYWFETMIFYKKKGIGGEWRHKTKSQAITHHNKVVNSLKEGKYKFDKYITIEGLE